MTKILFNVLIVSAVIGIPVSSFVLSLKEGKLYFKEILQYKSIIIKYIVAMFIISPVVAVFYDFIFKDYLHVWIAVLVISLSPPAYGLGKKLSPFGVSQNLSLLLIITGIILSLVFIPFALIILGKLFGKDLDLGIDDVILKISVTFIIPILIGFLVNKYLNKHVNLLIKIFEPVSKIAMLVLLICLLILGIPLIITKGIIPILLVILFKITLLAITHLLSLSEKSGGEVIPFSVILRLPAPAIVISQINHTVDKHLATILIFTITGSILILIYKKLIKPKDTPQTLKN